MGQKKANRYELPRLSSRGRKRNIEGALAKHIGELD